MFHVPSGTRAPVSVSSFLGLVCRLGDLGPGLVCSSPSQGGAHTTPQADRVG